jgi:PTH1 family peptidyl-tRNA hydrolase
MRLWRSASRRDSLSQPSVDWLIAGLGNPGERYEATRHNLGRWAVLELAARHAIALDALKLRSRFGLGRIEEQRVCLATPTTFMNESGQAVAPLARFYRVPAGRVLLASDDLDLPLGVVRIRPSGGPGGHNGLADVLAALGTEGVPRVRIGIGRPPPGWDAADYVLSRFAADEAAVAAEAADAASRAIESVLRDGLPAAMNRYN